MISSLLQLLNSYVTKVPTDPLSIPIAILAGGHSRRMGTPKALLNYQGKTLAQHLIDSLSPFSKELFIAGCPEAGLYENLPVPVVVDRMPDCGPLGGLASAMAFLVEQKFECPFMLAVPCDGVSLPEHYVSRMIEALQAPGVDVVFAKDAQRQQYLYCAVSLSLLSSLQDYLQQGERKVIVWMESQQYAVVDFSDQGFQFNNLNTPHDWQNFSQQ